jgi:hypothetical protein
MSRDILNGFGPNSPSPQAPVASNGGKMSSKEIPYSPPVGPKSINDSKSPGLHGTNHGNCPGQGRH